MKRETLEKHNQIANDVLYYVYTHIDTAINLDELSGALGVSKFHMHRIFKEVFDKNIHESVQSIRLQKAANLLLTNKYSTISEIAGMCGYGSHSSFIKAFKGRFGCSPKEWRNGEHIAYSNRVLQQSKKAMESTADFSGMEPTIVKMPTFQSYYIRNRGYDATIRQAWQKLQAWTLTHHLTKYKQIALFHDNPAVTPLDECQYIACIVPEEKLEGGHNRLPKFTISDGVYARFDLQGGHGDKLKFLHWVYHHWLPESRYESTTKPSYAIYRKNNFLSDDGLFDLSFYVSIRF